MNSIHDRRWRKIRDQVVREEPWCRLKLPGCTGASTTADHIIPRSIRRDLCHVRSNLRGSCASCNMKRGTKDLSTLHADLRRADAGPPALGFFNI